MKSPAELSTQDMSDSDSASEADDYYSSGIRKADDCVWKIDYVHKILQNSKTKSKFNSKNVKKSNLKTAKGSANRSSNSSKLSHANNVLIENINTGDKFHNINLSGKIKPNGEVQITVDDDNMSSNSNSFSDSCSAIDSEEENDFNS
jgi:hypothetical protein